MEFDALWLHGWANQAQLRAAIIARARGIPVLVRGESTLLGALKPSKRSALKKSLMPPLLRIADGYLAIGSRNHEWYRAHGVPEARIFPMPYAVDNEFFRDRAAEAASTREVLRRQLKLTPGRPVILFASKLQPRKRATDLFDAWARLSPDGVHEPEPYLLIVGEGEERSQLEARAKDIRWNSVRFIGFRNQTELPAYYDLCDVFVLPSENEPWGLVVNEVMNAGRPVIVADQVGCAQDLVIEGVTGHTFPTRDIQALSNILRRVTTNRESARVMGSAAAQHVGRWSFDSDLYGLCSALETTIALKATNQ